MDDGMRRGVIHRSRSVNRRPDIHGSRSVINGAGRVVIGGVAVIDIPVVDAPVIGSDDRARDGSNGATDKRAVVTADIISDDNAQSTTDNGAQRRVAGLNRACGKETQRERKDEAKTGFHSVLLVHE